MQNFVMPLGYVKVELILRKFTKIGIVEYLFFLNIRF